MLGFYWVKFKFFCVFIVFLVAVVVVGLLPATFDHQKIIWDEILGCSDIFYPNGNYKFSNIFSRHVTPEKKTQLLIKYEND